ncbi:MAG: hemolysin family protein [Polynucleobacter sp.]|nr:hemolysin family protein [Polynucleobacter sp.]
MEVVILIGLIVLNGLFAMSEIALVTSRKAKLQKLIDRGDNEAKVAVELGENPTKFLSTIQIGITSIGVLSGVVGESAVAIPMSQLLVSEGMDPKYAEWLSLGVVVAVITYLSIVIGELVPKRIAQNNPERIARYIAKPISALAFISKPFVLLLTGSTNFILRILGIKDRSNNEVTEEEIHAVLEEGTTAGLIEVNEHNMLRNVFRLDDRQIVSLMVPRADIVYLDVENTFAESIDLIDASEHARFPVVKGGLDNILGILNARKMLASVAKGGEQTLENGLQAPLYVPETLTGLELLENFKSSHNQMAFVIDEYGEVMGLITLQDLIESITGEFSTNDPEESWAIKREDGSWLFDGHIPIPEFKDSLELESVPEEDLGRYHTLSGLMMLLSGKIPNTGDIVEWAGWKLEIVDMDGKTIDKVLAKQC